MSMSQYASKEHFYEAKITELKQQRDHLESENAKQAEMLNKVIEQRDELLAALAFYANDEVYKSDSIGRPIDIAYVARATIAKVKP